MGINPARLGFPYIEIAQIRLYCSEAFNFGFGTRRRQKGLDYDAAKDADFGFLDLGF